MLQKLGDKGYDRLKRGQQPEVLAPNYRMSEPQAAVAAAQLERLESIVTRRERLGRLLTREIADLPGVLPHEVHAEDRCGYHFYYFRLATGKFSCDRGEFTRALQAQGAEVFAGYISVPLYRYPVFSNHSFFGGRWPIRESGLTSVDYSKHHNPEAEAILQSGVRVAIHEGMSDEYIASVAAAIGKVARHYAL